MAKAYLCFSLWGVGRWTIALWSGRCPVPVSVLMAPRPAPELQCACGCKAFARGLGAKNSPVAWSWIGYPKQRWFWGAQENVLWLKVWNFFFPKVPNDQDAYCWSRGASPVWRFDWHSTATSLALRFHLPTPGVPRWKTFLGLAPGQ